MLQLFIIIIIIIRPRALLLVAPVYSVRADNNLLLKVSRVLHSDTYNCAFFFFVSIQVPVPKSLLSPIKLFYVHVLLSSQSQLL